MHGYMYSFSVYCWRREEYRYLLRTVQVTTSNSCWLEGKNESIQFLPISEMVGSTGSGNPEAVSPYFLMSWTCVNKHTVLRWWQTQTCPHLLLENLFPTVTAKLPVGGLHDWSGKGSPSLTQGCLSCLLPAGEQSQPHLSWRIMSGGHTGVVLQVPGGSNPDSRC